MKIIKPLTLGILNRPYRYRGQHRLAIAALGFFRLGEKSADRFLTENVQWAKIVPDLPVGLALDQILPKANSEIMLSGVAHSPIPVEAMSVRLQCGPIDKYLRVIGDRNWQRRWWPSICVDAPKPFQKMPLTHERAYGGDGHDNPLGCGYLPRLPWLKAQEGPMPNIEYVGQAITPGRDAYPFASYAPQQLLHAERKRLVSGTYDKRWLAEDFPGFPRDFDFSLFNLAPVDQQFSGKIKGDEDYCLEGVHAKHSSLSGTLPGLSARAFILRNEQSPEQLEEVPLACDTVWFFPEHDIGMLVYRGEAPVVDSDALDVGTVMVAYERMADAPRSLAHYREVLALRLDQKNAALHAFNESQLAPPRSPEQIAARQAAREKFAVEQLIERQQLLDEHMAEFWQKSGMTPPADYTPPKAEPPKLNGPTADEIAEGDFDLSELHAQAQALADAARREGEARLAAGQAELKEKLAKNFPDTPLQQMPTVAEITRKALEQAAVVADDLFPGNAKASDPIPARLLEALSKAEHAKPGSVDAKQLADIRQSFAQVPAMKRAARSAALAPTTLTEPLPDAAAIALGQQALAWLSAGTSLAGRDLAGAYLRNADLRGSDLREVQLERADLRGANLTQANLEKSVLTSAYLDGADFSGARLDGANLCATHAEKAKFIGASLRGVRAIDAVWRQADLQGATLDDVIAMRIDLTGANLDDTVLARTVLSEARAELSSWRNANLSMSVATAANFATTDFTGARLHRTVLMDANLTASTWVEAQLSSCYAGGKATWKDAMLQGAHFKRCGLRGANMSGGDMRHGIFAQSDFGDADLSDAMLDDARFYRSLFLRSSLRRVQATRTDFFQAMCRKADFSNSAMQESVLVQADTSEAVFQAVEFHATKSHATKPADASMNQKARLP